MLATLAMIRDTYGSVDRYVIENCRIPPTMVEQIRQNMVVHLKDGEEPLDWRSLASLT
jgi:hypothetical protein